MSFQAIRATALALLNENDAKRMTRKAGSFCGQCAVDPSPLTASQLAWLNALAEKNGLPTIEDDL